MKRRTSCLLGPLKNTILYLNKPKIIRNSEVLSDLDYLPSKQKMWNTSRMQTHKPLISSVQLIKISAKKCAF